MDCRPGGCGHGKCINGSCMCDSGWSGHVDIYTQDLTAWGGPVLECVTNVAVLKTVWTITLIASLALIILAAIGIIQQWYKAKQLQAQGALARWFHHLPLITLLLTRALFLLGLVLLSVAKLQSPLLSETIGVTATATWGFVLVSVGAGVMNKAHALSVVSLPLNSFSAEEDSRLRAMLKATSCTITISSIAFLLSPLYPIIGSTWSSYTRRREHLILAYMFFGQMFLALFLSSSSNTLLTHKVHKYLNEVIAARRDALPNVPSQPQNGLADLLRMRIKILANLYWQTILGFANAIFYLSLICWPHNVVYYPYYSAFQIWTVLFRVGLMILSFTRLTRKLLTQRVRKPVIESVEGQAPHAVSVRVDGSQGYLALGQSLPQRQNNTPDAERLTPPARSSSAGACNSVANGTAAEGSCTTSREAADSLTVGVVVRGLQLPSIRPESPDSTVSMLSSQHSGNMRPTVPRTRITRDPMEC